jgi:hypothetical protein
LTQLPLRLFWQVPPCRHLYRCYVGEQIDLSRTVALLSPSPFGRYLWCYRASHGHEPLPDSDRERIWMRQNAVHSMMTAAASMPAGEESACGALKSNIELLDFNHTN